MHNENNTQDEIVTFRVQKVYDPFLRFLHLWNGLSVFSLVLTILLKNGIENFQNGPDILFRIHIYIGYALTAGITARCLWGFVGPEHAKFKNMLFVADWIKILKTRKYEESDQWGHDKYASLSYLVFYVLMAYQIVSGLVFAARYFNMGPLSSLIAQTKEKNAFIHFLKETHEVIFYVTVAYIFLHIGMIFFHELKNKHPIAQSMFSGFQYRKFKK